MGRAIQCDRCGRFASFKDLRSSPTGHFGATDGWKRIGDNRYLSDPGQDSNTDPIICPTCATLHNDFMTNKPVPSSRLVTQVEYVPTNVPEHESEPDATGDNKNHDAATSFLKRTR